MPVVIAGQDISGKAILEFFFRHDKGPKCPYPCKGYIQKAQDSEEQFVCTKCGYVFVGRSSTSVSQLKPTKNQIVRWKAYKAINYSNIKEIDNGIQRRRATRQGME